MATFPEPQAGAQDTAQTFLRYLDYFRAVTIEKLEGLTEEQLRCSVLPSGWTPLELIKHLIFMERRWFRWGFQAEQVDRPWGDQGPDGRWHVDPDETLEQLADQLLAGGERTRATVESATLDTPAVAASTTPRRDSRRSASTSFRSTRDTWGIWMSSAS